jgi:CBS domain-containing protein
MERFIETRARDLMQRDVITVAPETPILDVHRLFVEEEIHGAPVVDDTGRVRGVLSALDLLRIVRDELEPADPEDGVAEATASDAMTKELVTVSPASSVEEIARTMLAHHVHRVLVIGADRELEGVITTFDLLRVLVPSKRGREQIRETGYHR